MFNYHSVDGEFAVMGVRIGYGFRKYNLRSVDYQNTSCVCGVRSVTNGRWILDNSIFPCVVTGNGYWYWRWAVNPVDIWRYLSHNPNKYPIQIEIIEATAVLTTKENTVQNFLRL